MSHKILPSPSPTTKNNLSQINKTNRKSLPSECLQQIFAHLSYSKSSLHSCLLVNRLWCVNVVKVLWSQPFHLLNICPNKGPCNRTQKDTHAQCAALINVYLYFLDREEKNNLLNNRIKLNNNNNSSKTKDKDNSNASLEPTFNYIEFLRYLDLEELFITVGVWKQYTIFNSNHNSNYSKSTQKNSFKKTLKRAVNTITRKSSSILKKKSSFNNLPSSKFGVDGFPVAVDRVVSYSLAKLIMSKCKQLKSLSIDTRISGHNPCHCLVPINNTNNIDDDITIVRQNVPEEHLLIATYAGANKCLLPLTEFICTTRGTKWRLFHAMAGICKQLKKIVVDMGGYTTWTNSTTSSSTNHSQQSTTLMSLIPYTEPQMQELEWEAKNLATLLQSQSSLESFTLLRGEIGLLTILGALKSQVNSLKHLEFVQLNTKYAQWGAFYNILDYVELEELAFKECELSDDLMRPLITSKKDVFKNIQVLNFEKSIASSDAIEKFIINTGSTLEKLILGNHSASVSSKSSTTDPISLIEITGQYCPNLTHFSTFVDTVDIPQLLTLFTLCPLLRSIELSGRFFPINIIDMTCLLEQITLQNLLSNLTRLVIRTCSFTPIALENYLYNVRPPLKYLEISQSYFFNTEHLKILIDYAKENQQLKNVFIETFDEFPEGCMDESTSVFESFEYRTIYPVAYRDC